MKLRSLKDEHSKLRIAITRERAVAEDAEAEEEGEEDVAAEEAEEASAEDAVALSDPEEVLRKKVAKVAIRVKEAPQDVLVLLAISNLEIFQTELRLQQHCSLLTCLLLSMIMHFLNFSKALKSPRPMSLRIAMEEAKDLALSPLKQRMIKRLLSLQSIRK